MSLVTLYLDYISQITLDPLWNNQKVGTNEKQPFKNPDGVGPQLVGSGGYAFLCLTCRWGRPGGGCIPSFCSHWQGWCSRFETPPLAVPLREKPPSWQAVKWKSSCPLILGLWVNVCQGPPTLNSAREFHVENMWKSQHRDRNTLSVFDFLVLSFLNLFHLNLRPHVLCLFPLNISWTSLFAWRTCF